MAMFSFGPHITIELDQASRGTDSAPWPKINGSGAFEVKVR